MRQPEPAPAVHDAAVALGRALRAGGLATTVESEVDFCRALGEVAIDDRDEVYWAARSLFVRSPEQLEAFDAVFRRFWLGAELIPAPRGSEHGESDPRMSGPQHGGESLPQLRAFGRGSTLVDGGLARASREIPTAGGQDGEDGRRRGALAAYSPAEVFADPQPLDYAADELAAVRRLAEELRAAAPERRSRRPAPRRRGRLDMRRTMRAALRTDGELMRPRFSGPSQRPRRLVFLCDVSGSMERYSRVLLASLRAAVASGARAEAFVFATRLTRVTRSLRRGSAERTLARARAEVADWSGGTRIGEVLGEFNRGWGRRGIARGAIVIIVSDGWDRGDPDQLARELHRLRLQARRLAWVNPRPLGLESQPLAIGMRAALPHLDEFVPGHDPRAIAGFARLIAGLGGGRPGRRRAVSSGAGAATRAAARKEAS